MKIKIFTIITLCALLLSSCGAASKDSVNNDNKGNNNLFNNFLDGNIQYGAAADMEVSVDQSGAILVNPDNTVTNQSKPNDTTEFGKIIENEFVSASENNVSTFSADVDTASYAYFRKLVNSG